MTSSILTSSTVTSSTVTSNTETSNTVTWRTVTSSTLAAATVLLLAFQGCAEPPTAPILASRLARGAAHAEIDQWAEARDLFTSALEIAPDEPTLAYNLAVASFRTGDRATAREWLERAKTTAPLQLHARIALLRAKLAYEDGDDDAELEAVRETMTLAPEEAAYAFALAQIHLRRGEPKAHGTTLEQALQLWPENTYLAAERVLWALAQPDPARYPPAVELMQSLAATTANPEITRYVEQGQRELAEALVTGEVDRGRVPPSFRIAINLLRATKRFQSHATELQARLEPTLFSRPVGGGPRLRPPATDLSYQAATLMTMPTLDPGEKILQAIMVDDALAVAAISDDAADANAPDGANPDPTAARSSSRKPRRREAGIALLTDRRLIFLDADAEAFQPISAFTGGRQILAGDLDGDGRMELVALADSGLEIWTREEPPGRWTRVALDPDLAAAGDLRRGLLVDFEHDGDLDLLAVDSSGRLIIAIHRGEAGLGPAGPAALPVTAGVRHLTSSDLDADADQDLILTTSTELLVLRNWRQGDFGLHTRLALPRGEQPLQLVTLDTNADSHMDVVVLLKRGFAFWRGDGRAHLSRDDQAQADTLLFSENIQPKQLTVADLDLDGDQDLLVAGTAAGPQGAGLVALLNDSTGRFDVRTDLLAKPWPAARGALTLDLDGDHDPDVLSWGEAGLLRTFRSRGAEHQGWLTLYLTAPARKVPRDGHGVRLQVSAGDSVQWLELRRPNVTLGLGREQPAVIKATWPNGISEYLFEPAAEAEHTLELSMRVEGSCPFLYAWDGRQQRFVTDILGLSPVGMLAAPGHYVPPDPEEYLRLPSWVAPLETGEHAGALELVITEELREALYLDQVELVAVDAPEFVEVYNGEQWLKRPIRGLALRLLSPLMSPTSVRDDQGRDVLEVVRARDDRYLTNHSGANRYQGAVQPHRLTVELPPDLAAAEHPALILVGWLHWGNTSTNVARSQDPAGAPVFPILVVDDGHGGWRRTDVEVGLPSGKTKPIVVDLTGVLDPAHPQLRLTTDFEVYWDHIAVAALQPVDTTPHRLHRLAPVNADLRWGGFSRWFRTAANGPYEFDYTNRRDTPWRLDSTGRELTLSWQELEGYYTAFGQVGDLLGQADDQLAVLGSGDEVHLRFGVANLPSLPAGWRRTYFLHSEGWEKDGDPNVSCAQTVEPLPYRGMAYDPCSGRLKEPAPDGAKRTRWVGRDRLARRVAALEGS